VLLPNECIILGTGDTMGLRVGDKVIDLKSLVQSKYVFNYNWSKKECRIHDVDCSHYKGRRRKDLGSRGGWSKPFDTYEEAYDECLRRVGKDSIFNCKDCCYSGGL